MADLFSKAVQPTTASPFDGLGGDPQPAPSILPDATIDRTARMATMALAPAQELLSNYQGITAQYADNIRAYGDEEVRNQAAVKQQQNSIAAIGRLVNQFPTDNGVNPIQETAQTLASNVLNEDVSQRKEYALEQMAFENIQNLAASGDYVQAKVLMNQIIHGDPEEIMKDINVKRSIIGREVERAQVAEQDRPWFLHATDFVASTIGDLTLQGSLDRNNIVDIDKSMTHWWDWIISGNRQRAEAAELWKKNPADFAKAIREQVIPRIQEHTSTFGYSNHSEALNLLTGLQDTPSPWETNLGDAVNAGGLLTFLPIGKAVTLPAMMVRAGAKREAAAAIADTTIDAMTRGTKAAEAASGISTQEILDNIVPSSVNPATPLDTVPMTGDILAGIERGRALLAELPEIRQAGRLTQDEFETAITKEQAAIQKEVGRPLKNFTTEPIKLSDGSTTYRYTMDLGKKRGGGFISADGAKSFAESLGIMDAEPVLDESGQWFARVQKDMNEAGFYSTQLEPGLAKTGLVGRLTLGARQVGDDILQEFDRASANARNKTIKVLKDRFGPVLEAVPSGEKPFLENVIAWGNNNSTWVDKDTFDELWARQGRTEPPSQATYDAYQAHRDLNDIEFAMRNDIEWKRDATRGFSTVSFKHPQVSVNLENALVNRSAQVRPTGRIFDASTGIHYNVGKNPLSDQRFKDMIDDGYALVTLKREKSLMDGTTVKQFLIKKSELEERTLRRDQLPYRAGGHRMYSDKYFAKQTDFGTQPDTGEKFLKNPNTFITGTKAEVEKWVKIMEQARLYTAGVGVKKVDLAILEDLLKPLGHWDAKEFMDNVAAGKINLKHSIEAMYDRELPEEYSHTRSGLDFVDPEEQGFTGWMRTQGRMYYSGRGEGLTDWQGELAKTIDPFETINAAMTNIANLTSFSDYKLSAVERWVNTYKDYLDYPPKSSELTIFSEGKYRTTVDKRPMGAGERVKQQMEAQRDIIRRNLGWRSELDRATDRYTQNIADFIMGHDPTSVRHAVGRVATNWIEEHNPLNMMRGLAFDLKMGFFNVAQFPLQIQTMLATAALAPEHAGGAFVNLPFMRAYLTKNGSEELLDLAIKRGMHEVNGLAPEEYKVMMRMGKQSGFFEFGGTHQMINSYGPNAVYGGYAKGYDRLRSAGRWFFNEGETWNRITAWQVAYKELIGSIKYPAKLTDATLAQFYEEFGRKVSLRADDYSMSMMEQGSAMWQKGILSIPTQFWAYNARMLEAMTGKQFSNAQKIRLFAAQTFFYGAAGAPVVGALSDVYKKHEGHALPLDSVAGWFDRGLFDEMAYHMTGADVQIGKRYGGGTWMTDLVGEIMGMSPYGEKSFVDVVGGATYSILKNTAQTLATTIKHTVAESGAQDYPLSKDDWLKFAENVSTISYGTKAYMALKYHAFISTKGTVVVADLPSIDAFYFALGIGPGAQDQVSAAAGYLKDRKKAILDATKFYSDKRNEMALKPDRRDEIAAQVNAYSRSIPPDIRMAALKKAHRGMPDTLVHSLTQQVQKDQAQRDLINQYGKSN